jgi:hypothetical protein
MREENPAIEPPRIWLEGQILKNVVSIKLQSNASDAG